MSKMFEDWNFARVCWNKSARGSKHKIRKTMLANQCRNTYSFKDKAVNTFEKKPCSKIQKSVKGHNSMSTETANKDNCLEKSTSNANTQTEVCKVYTIHCNSEVACQTNLPDETLRKVRELEFQLHRVTEITEDYMDLCKENELDRQEKEEIICHLENQVATLTERCGSGNGRRRRQRKPKN